MLSHVLSKNHAVGKPFGPSGKGGDDTHDLDKKARR